MLLTRVETRIRQEYSALCVLYLRKCFVSLYRREVAAKKATEESSVKERKEKVAKENKIKRTQLKKNLRLE